MVCRLLSNVSTCVGVVQLLLLLLFIALVSDTIAAQLNGDGEEAFLSAHSSTTNDNSIVYAGLGFLAFYF
jgi:hypothetical protein